MNEREKESEPKARRKMLKPRAKKAGTIVDRVGIARLGVGVLRQAVNDMRGKDGQQWLDNPKHPAKLRERRFHNRARATAWLASKQATIYFDLVGLDQQMCLEECDWKRYANEVLAKRPKKRLPRDVRVLLRETLWALC